MRPIAAPLVLCITFAFAGCQTPLTPSHEGAGSATTGPLSSEGVQPRTNGGGHYTIPGGFDLEFAFSALVLPNGRTEGNFHHRGTVDGELIDFRSNVTCLSVDSVNHRAWIGGVITENRSTHPQFTTEVHEVGHDIWFRVQDNGPGQADPQPDVTTIVGFEPIFPSSQAYCDGQPWRTTNVWPVQGNLTVSP